MLTPERLQHGRVTRATDTIADSDGSIGHPWLVESLLERLERQGDIGSRERHAGEEFQRLFRAAHLDPLRAADLRRDSIRAQSDMPASSERAKRRVLDALDALGGHHAPCATAAWFILGCELSIAEWARREGWGGKPIRRDVAKGTLLGALGVLARHFGT